MMMLAPMNSSDFCRRGICSSALATFVIVWSTQRPHRQRPSVSELKISEDMPRAASAALASSEMSVLQSR